MIQGFSQWTHLTWYFSLKKECTCPVDGHCKGMNKFDFCKGICYSCIVCSNAQSKVEPTYLKTISIVDYCILSKIFLKIRDLNNKKISTAW